MCGVCESFPFSLSQASLCLLLGAGTRQTVIQWLPCLLGSHQLMSKVIFKLLTPAYQNHQLCSTKIAPSPTGEMRIDQGGTKSQRVKDIIHHRLRRGWAFDWTAGHRRLSKMRMPHHNRCTMHWRGLLKTIKRLRVQYIIWSSFLQFLPATWLFLKQF